MPEQAPGAAQGADQPGRQGGQAQGDEDDPARQLHHQIGPLDRLRVLAGQAGDAEGEEGNDGAEPADRGGDVGGERELAQPRGQGHGLTPVVRCGGYGRQLAAVSAG